MRQMNSTTKTYDRLKAKSNDEGRMPTVKQICKLLDDEGIEYDCDTWSEYKTTSGAGMRYSTGGGSKLYEGYRLAIDDGVTKVRFDTTDSCYSVNTWSYAGKIVKIVDRARRQ